MKFQNVDNYLAYINLFNSFSPWLYKDDDLCFLVDPGSMRFVDHIVKGLDTFGVSEGDLDYILLTHIHVDHAGSVGKLIDFFPQVKIICHPNGIKHLINPKRLWEQSLKILGKGAEIAGKILPIPKDRILTQEHIKHYGIKVIETLGHAPHHQSYIFKNYLFIGEAAGHNLLIPEFKYEFIYPATPPVFDYEKYIASIENLLKEDIDNCMICYPHVGMRENARKMVKLGYEQITVWMRVFNALYEDRDNPDFFGLLLDELKKEDKIFAKYDQLPENYKNMLPMAIRDSIKGIFGYIMTRKKKKIKF